MTLCVCVCVCVGWIWIASACTVTFETPPDSSDPIETCLDAKVQLRNTWAT